MIIEMVSVVFYFHAHQPFRVKKYRIFDIGVSRDYFDDDLNKRILGRVVRKCYRPMNKLLLELIKDYNLKVSFSISGVLIEQLELWYPDVLDLFGELVDTGNVELLAETYYHSLASIFSEREFKEQVRKHVKKLREVFNYKPRAFRNTELVYSNEIAKNVRKLGFKVMLTEGTEKILGWRSPTYVYKAKGIDLKLLLRHYKLSDDIAFRFSNPNWEEFPLTAEKYATWISSHNGNGYVVNIFMDYETFGEHQWPETGIFEFFRNLPKEILKHPDNDFATVSEAASRYEAVDEIDVPYIISWADLERDLSAWLGDSLQHEAAKNLYEIEKAVKRYYKKCGDEQILEAWRKLTTADHLYYMSLKYDADGDIHKYFRDQAFPTPFDAFVAFMNILHDLKMRVGVKK